LLRPNGAATSGRRDPAEPYRRRLRVRRRV